MHDLTRQVPSIFFRQYLHRREDQQELAIPFHRKPNLAQEVFCTVRVLVRTCDDLHQTLLRPTVPIPTGRAVVELQRSRVVRTVQKRQVPQVFD